MPTTHFDDAFHALAGDLDACGGLAPMRRLDGRALVALDGTEFFRSRKLRCDHCSTRKRADGGTEHFHQMLAANVVAPGRAQSLPLPPEFVRPQDGAAKQDCERQAVKRWLARHACCFSLSPVGSPRDLTGLFRRRIAWEDGAIREWTGAGAIAFLMNRRCRSGEDVGARASSVGKRWGSASFSRACPHAP